MTNSIKRCIDISGALAGLVLLSPVLLVTALLIRCRMGSPVLFRQPRPGLGGRPFRIYKFRTMNDRRGADGALLPDGERLTRVGEILRGASLDELPQLLNVLEGTMSLVGPRPLLMSYLPRYTPRQFRRHDVKPGLTGWAQVNGRNALSWEDKFELDLWYVENRGTWLDLRIVALTVAELVRPKGINHQGYSTMPEFLGTPGGPKEAL